MKQHRLLTIIKQPNGQLASSTGNITGIYDLSGGAWEQVSNYITNGNENLSNGTVASGIPSLVAKTTADATAYQLLSSKYATIYPYNSLNDTKNNNYIVYSNAKNASYGYGDAILETSDRGEGEDPAMAWFGDYSTFTATIYPFFARGGRYNNETIAGMFTFGLSTGDVYSNQSFRTVLVVI